MTTTTERVYRRGPFPVKFRLLEVKRVTRVTPQMVRITLAGEDLEGFYSPGADDHVKLLFPEEGKRMPVIPTVTPTGLVLKEGERKPDARDYTPRRYDAAAGELDIDFVVHGTGPATTWASKAQVGDLLAVGGPRGSTFVAQDFSWYLLAGDPSALPAIGRILEELPEGTRAIVFCEVPDASEEQQFTTRANATVTWIHRNGVEAGHSDVLQQAIRGLEFPAGDYFAWVAGEAHTVRPIKDHLINERGANKSWVRVTGYWKRGTSDHHDAKG
ncbi:siderophore-interacting protein [Myxococcus sp. NMCA1]|uniref:siderophore-interacting protein n=1 Tax=Myxococcus sp. NMCA1 TaxID=2996785 RepID=UPI0022866213|nr:siderophore-interacting protein [Myxococcus sp. NMCA1]WAM30075.1 siderophore-interacting protein [Myxococcus sp. NMCA1]